jgi:hypothetical protein
MPIQQKHRMIYLVITTNPATVCNRLEEYASI